MMCKFHFDNLTIENAPPMIYGAPLRWVDLGCGLVNCLTNRFEELFILSRFNGSTLSR